MWLIRLWMCNHLPWHRPLSGSFWLSEQTEVHQCSCGRQWATNHTVGGTLPYDDELIAFYQRLGRLNHRRGR